MSANIINQTSGHPKVPPTDWLDEVWPKLGETSPFGWNCFALGWIFRASLFTIGQNVWRIWANFFQTIWSHWVGAAQGRKSRKTAETVSGPIFYPEYSFRREIQTGLESLPGNDLEASGGCKGKLFYYHLGLLKTYSSSYYASELWKRTYRKSNHAGPFFNRQLAIEVLLVMRWS